MAIQPVLRMGDPRLLTPSKEITAFNTTELDQLITDMKDTMQELNGAGLAAPQIGVQKRVVIFGMESNPRYPEAESVPYTILINPVIEPLTQDIEDGWEGCLSIPGMLGLVPRYKRIRYQGQDQKGNPIDREADGFHARVVQHECDHLDGVLYPMRIKDMRYFGFQEEFMRNL